MRKRQRKKTTAVRYRANEFVRAEFVRLVDEKDEHVGVVSRQEALDRARTSGMDLVEVSPDTDPPVCKLLDFDKYRYSQQKKKHKQKKRSKTELKEMRIGLFTDEHDLDFKGKRVREFLEEHHKVLLSLHLSGREKAHGAQALQQLGRFAERFSDLAKVERPPVRESSARVTMMICPRTIEKQG